MKSDKKSWHVETTENVDVAACNGDPRAQTVLGFRYQCGIEGLPEDQDKAVLFFQSAAKQGLTAAQICLSGNAIYECGKCNSENSYFEMLLWSIEDNDISGFQKLVKLFEPLKRRNAIERSLSSMEKDRVLNMCFSRACRRGFIDMAKVVFLEAKNLDINQITIESYPPLDYAASTGDFELAEFCLRVGADPFRYDKANNNTKTPLEIARKNGHTKLALLLEQAEGKRFFGRAKSLFVRKLKGGGWI